MRIEILKCDLCGKEINRGWLVGSTTYSLSLLTDNGLNTGSEVKEKEICCDCAEIIYDKVEELRKTKQI